MKKKPSNDQEMRMPEAEFDRVMSRALGVAPPPVTKKTGTRKRVHKKRS